MNNDIYEEEKIKEQTLKNFISFGNILETLETDGLFIDKENSVVEFEKSINNNNTIVDCLIQAKLESGNYCLVGIEIKSEYDNTRRLKKQLADYLTICDFVYVFAHEKHEDKINNILKTLKGGSRVGVILYDVYDEKILAYLSKCASLNSISKYSYVNSLLTKVDLQNFLYRKYNKQASKRTGSNRKPSLVNYIIQTEDFQEIRKYIIDVRKRNESHFGKRYNNRKYSNALDSERLAAAWNQKTANCIRRLKVLEKNR